MDRLTTQAILGCDFPPVHTFSEQVCPGLVQRASSHAASGLYHCLAKISLPLHLLLPGTEEPVSMCAGLMDLEVFIRAGNN